MSQFRDNSWIVVKALAMAPKQATSTATSIATSMLVISNFHSPAMTMTTMPPAHFVIVFHEHQHQHQHQQQSYLQRRQVYLSDTPNNGQGTEQNCSHFSAVGKYSNALMETQKLANARSYGVLKSLRSSARYAKQKSKSAINLNGHLKKQQKLEEDQAGNGNGNGKKKQDKKRKLRQSLSEDQDPIYANVDEVIPIHPEPATEVNALMGNAQVRGPNPEPRTQIQFSSSPRSICIR
ncbi:hypothetical protein M5D96_011059 [Drosophila gunungcola]|uniref:Uncharacterized protein n=1 Tax=Drosophila gunungcola TaxID=103775 RepID=A0A9Q0BLU8_9MUSC|nr:hypothetical protein M5D96_011059 [Drosophila gunungcola]